ncbi:MAG: hypothetical protein LBV50_08820 [Novosphingobium sp.]|jgi:hypothetical protein|nr:hypothetical protein [Novosphingobium sp.]
MKLTKRIETENAAIRFAIYERDDGLFQIDQEMHQAGDEYAGSCWLSDQVGLFGSTADIENYLSEVSPRPLNQEV